MSEDTVVEEVEDQEDQEKIKKFQYILMIFQENGLY